MGFLKNLFSDLFTNKIAIDLGTANTLIYYSGKKANSGIVLNEPSVAAFTYHKGHLIPYGFGSVAKLMLGRTPVDIKVIRPLKDGVIADFHAAEEMIKYFIKSITMTRIPFSRLFVIVCVPQESTPVERRAIQEAVESAGGRHVFLIEEPMAAAIGAALPVLEPVGSMVIDIGGGTTEVGVLSLGGIVTARSIRVGGDSMDQAIVSYIRNKYNLLIGDATAETVKRGLSNYLNDDYSEQINIKGRDSITGVPKEITASHDEILHSLDDVIASIVEAIVRTLERCPPELSGDIMEHGVKVTGGGAALPNIAQTIQSMTGLKVSVTDEPLYCVARGVGIVLDNPDKYKHVLFRQD